MGGGRIRIFGFKGREREWKSCKNERERERKFSVLARAHLKNQSTIENNDQVQPHFAQLHVTKNFWYAQTIFYMHAKVHKGAIWRFLYLNNLKIKLFSKYDKFASL